MADTTTELEVLDQIVDVLGGTSGQYETVVPTLQQIRDLLGGGGGDPSSGYNPSLSVGRADALTGADSTAQWAARESTGSGAATVRSVQGAAVAFQQWRKPADGSATGTYSGVSYVRNADGSVTVGGTATGAQANIYPYVFQAGELTVGHKYLIKGCCPAGGSATTYYGGIGGSSHDLGNGYIWTNTVTTGGTQLRICVRDGATIPESTLWPQFFDLTAMFGAGNEPATVEEFEAMYPASYYPYSAPTLKPVQIAGIQSKDAQGGELDSVEWTAQTLRAAGNVRDELTAGELVTRVGSRAYQSGDESDSTVRTDGTTTFYALAEPTTTPISPALPMTYRVEQSGSESIIVPDGEISAAPILTVAEGESAATVVMDALAAIAAPDGPTATANHSVGTYLTMQGKLYKVTSAIAVGETIKSGTNVTQTTVMAELIARTA